MANSACSAGTEMLDQAALVAKPSILAFLGLLASAADASSVTARVAEIHVRASDGLQYVIMAGASSTRPACAATYPYYMIKSEQSDSGRAQFAMLLSAKLSGRSVTVEGAGICTRWVDGEDINQVSIIE